MFSLEITGLQELERTLQRVAREVEHAILQAVRNEAESILEASRPLVPIDTGLLLSTGLVRELHDGAEISYGGKGLAGYSIRIHEDTTLNHPHGGQSHYLSQPLFEATADMPQRLAAFIEGRLRSL